MKYTFRAKLVKDDKRSGFKKGKKFDPRGFYYNQNNQIILVGSMKDKHCGMLAFPIDNVEVEVIGQVAQSPATVLLICEDASHLGGPMGSEYTTHVFSKVFPSIQKAKDYAVKYQKKGWPPWAKWEESGGVISCDSGCYIWRIEEQ